MLAKVCSYIVMTRTRKVNRWEDFLPERYHESCKIESLIPKGNVLKQMTRGLSSMFDMLAKQFNSGKSI